MANRQNTGATEGGATEGAQDPSATLVPQNTGLGASTPTGPSLQTAGLKNRLCVLLYFILVHMYLIT
jgi:hypothetical protein